MLAWKSITENRQPGISFPFETLEFQRENGWYGESLTLSCAVGSLVSHRTFHCQHTFPGNKNYNHQSRTEA